MTDEELVAMAKKKAEFVYMASVGCTIVLDIATGGEEIFRGTMDEIAEYMRFSHPGLYRGVRDGDVEFIWKETPK
jgi:hypothetical protein